VYQDRDCSTRRPHHLSKRPHIRAPSTLRSDGHRDLRLHQAGFVRRPLLGDHLGRGRIQGPPPEAAPPAGASTTHSRRARGPNSPANRVNLKRFAGIERSRECRSVNCRWMPSSSRRRATPS
jgi:hypothetical protein